MPFHNLLLMRMNDKAGVAGFFFRRILPAFLLWLGFLNAQHGIHFAAGFLQQTVSQCLAARELFRFFLVQSRTVHGLDIGGPSQPNQVEHGWINGAAAEDYVGLQRTFILRQRAEKDSDSWDVFKSGDTAICAGGFQCHGVAADLPQFVTARLHIGVQQVPIDSSQMLLVGSDRFTHFRGELIIEAVDDGVSVGLDDGHDFKACACFKFVDSGIGDEFFKFRAGLVFRCLTGDGLNGCTAADDSRRGAAAQ